MVLKKKSSMFVNPEFEKLIEMKVEEMLKENIDESYIHFISKYSISIDKKPTCVFLHYERTEDSNELNGKQIYIGFNFNI